MTYKEYCEMIDKSNFIIDSNNPYDMKILKILKKCVEEKPTNVGVIDNDTTIIRDIMLGCCPKCMGSVSYGDNFCPECGQVMDWNGIDWSDYDD